MAHIEPDVIVCGERMDVDDGARNLAELRRLLVSSTRIKIKLVSAELGEQRDPAWNKVIVNLLKPRRPTPIFLIRHKSDQDAGLVRGNFERTCANWESIVVGVINGREALKDVFWDETAGRKEIRNKW